MSTKDLHPELGSGALREALEELCSMWETEKETELPTERSRWYEMALVRCARDVRRALSLSSPIEPEPETGALVTDGVPSFYPKVVNQARPTPQASSEIREALTARRQDFWNILARWDDDESYSVDDAIRDVAALAHSRQGAGGK